MDLGEYVSSTAPGDIWRQIFIHSGQIISPLDTKSLKKIHWNQIELLLSWLPDAEFCSSVNARWLWRTMNSCWVGPAGRATTFPVSLRAFCCCISPYVYLLKIIALVALDVPHSMPRGRKKVEIVWRGQEVILLCPHCVSRGSPYLGF